MVLYIQSIITFYDIKLIHFITMIIIIFTGTKNNYINIHIIINFVNLYFFMELLKLISQIIWVFPVVFRPNLELFIHPLKPICHFFSSQILSLHLVFLYLAVAFYL